MNENEQVQIWKWWKILKAKEYFTKANSLAVKCAQQERLISLLTPMEQCIKKSQSLFENKYWQVVSFPMYNGRPFLITLKKSEQYLRPVKLTFSLFDCNALSQKSEVYMNVEHDNDHIGIIDLNIARFEANQGYGTMLMSELLRYAKMHKVTRISGWLSFIDLDDHPERLQHFYRKFGFTITDIVSADGNVHEKRIELHL